MSFTVRNGGDQRGALWISPGAVRLGRGNLQRRSAFYRLHPLANYGPADPPLAGAFSFFQPDDVDFGVRGVAFRL
jgi:hypothetical protein